MVRNEHIVCVCVLVADEPMLLFANRHDVRQLHLYTGRYQLIYGGMHAAIAVDYDMNTSAVFWSDITSKNISRCVRIESHLLRYRFLLVCQPCWQSRCCF